MGKNSFDISSEMWAGAALVILGLIALAVGWHGLIAEALAPFGVGLILSDLLTRFGKAARESVKIRIRRDDD